MSKKTINQNKRILIIEDEGDICLLLNIMLQGKKVDLEHVNTLEAAKQQLSESEFPLLILDNKLPDGKGVNFIQYEKANYPSTKIVMISGLGAETAEAALKNGADKFLEKPFTRSQMFESVEALLN